MNKIIFTNGVEFETAEYPVETEPSIFAKRMIADGMNREYLRITVTAAYADVVAAFVNGAKYSIRQYDLAEDGNELETCKDFDWSEYCIAGDIVDHRDGRVTVYMAKPTEYEVQLQALETENAALLFEYLTGSEFTGEAMDGSEVEE